MKTIYLKGVIMKFQKLFSMSNSKLKKDAIASFNLQAGETCPRAGSCLKYCYASKGAYRWSPAINKRKKAYAMSLKSDFIDVVNKALNGYNGKYRTIRLHDSGDFYSNEYFQKWVTIASMNPTYHFYAYTKSFVLIDLEILPLNMKIIQSVGSLDDNKINKNLPHARIFRDSKSLERAGYTDCSKSDLPASKSDVIKVGLVMH